MYQIYAGATPVYAMGGLDGSFTVFKPKYQQEINKAGQVTFTILPVNSAYDSLAKLNTPISVYRDNDEIFYGRVLSVEKDFYNQKAVTCEGALAFLNDAILRPFEFRDETAQCVKKYIKYVLDLYNADVDDWKKIYVGNVTVSDSNNYLYRHKETYNSAYDTLIDHTIKSSLGGYLRTRRSGGKTYLDYTAQSGEQSVQYIEYGKNLLDLTEHATAEDVFTVLIPTGRNEEEIVTIESVNDGKDYIESAEGIAKYGRVWATKSYDNITKPETLLRTARADLAVGVQENVSLELSAVDLGSIGIDAQSFNCGDYVPVLSIPHGISTYFVCNKITLALDAPEESTYQMGASQASLIEQQLGFQRSSSSASAIAGEALSSAEIASATASSASATAQGAASTAQSAATAAASAEGAAQNAVRIAQDSASDVSELAGRVTALEARKRLYGASSTDVLAQGYADVNVSFSQDFTATPVVMLQNTVDLANVSLSVLNSSRGGFTARVWNMSDSDTTVNFTWLAET